MPRWSLYIPPHRPRSSNRPPAHPARPEGSGEVDLRRLVGGFGAAVVLVLALLFLTEALWGRSALTVYLLVTLAGLLLVLTFLGLSYYLSHRIAGERERG